MQQTFSPVNDIAWGTTYFHEFVCQNDSPSHIGLEEGKIRVLAAGSPNNGYDGIAIEGKINFLSDKRGAYGYFSFPQVPCPERYKE